MCKKGNTTTFFAKRMKTWNFEFYRLVNPTWNSHFLFFENECVYFFLIYYCCFQCFETSIVTTYFLFLLIRRWWWWWRRHGTTGTLCSLIITRNCSKYWKSSLKSLKMNEIGSEIVRDMIIFKKRCVDMIWNAARC